MPSPEGNSSTSAAGLSRFGPPVKPQRHEGQEAAKRELTELLVAEGVDSKRAEHVAEATIRRAWANEGRSVFYYADIEHEFLQQLRDAGVDPEGIESTKRRVWTAARATAKSNGLPMEEALYFCYAEGMDVQHDFLVAVGVSDDEPEEADSESGSDE
jgi:hypothetical protein